MSSYYPARRAPSCGAADASSALQTALLASSLATFAAGAAPGGPAVVASLARRLAPLETLADVQAQTGLMLAAYVLQYAVLGGLFEGTHPHGVLSSTLPAEAVRARRAQVWFEVKTGVASLAITVALAVAWGYAVEPRLWTFAFFETHAWTPAWGVAGAVAYVAAFDAYFYATHWALHESEWLWHNIHYVHHQIKEPSAFAQFAVHPVEAAIQGPLGHFIVQALFPIHPIQMAAMGFFFSAWAFAAHDGRGGDVNSHALHHTKGRGRKYYFNLGFITPVIDVWMGTRWSPDHPLQREWDAAKARGAKDTRDGTAAGADNDAFHAYKQAHKAKSF